MWENFLTTVNIPREWLCGWDFCSVLDETEMAETKESVLDRFAVQAIAGGAKTLTIEYHQGYEEVYAGQGDVGISIGCRIPSSSAQAKSLRAELCATAKHPRRIDVGGRTYELRCRTYDSSLERMRLK
jgi:hypothetical protein